jgi:hypothetical protein
MKRTLSGAITVLGLSLVCIALSGCGGPEGVGKVSGTVTLEGKPLAFAIVRFAPKNGGAPSRAITDESGRYSLQYTRSHAGAVVGEHIVSISTYAAAIPDADPAKPEVPEKVPAKYNAKSELVVTVKSGSNTLDFPLDLKGAIAQTAKDRSQWR